MFANIGTIAFEAGWHGLQAGHRVTNRGPARLSTNVAGELDSAFLTGASTMHFDNF